MVVFKWVSAGLISILMKLLDLPLGLFSLMARVSILRFFADVGFALFDPIYNWLRARRFDLCFTSRDSDIVIASYMKSGTTWMQMIMYQLTSDGAMDFGHIYDVSPYLEECGNTWRRLRKLDAALAPRLLKTHESYDFISRKCPRGKVVYVMRDGRDVAVSEYHHLKSHFFPELEFDHAFEHFVGRPNGWFAHVRDWLANRKGREVLYLRYEDLSHDLEAGLRQIIAFCGLQVPEHEMPRIIERCHFTFMKAHQDKFGLLPDQVRAKQKEKNFIRKGRTKEGAKYLSEAQTARFAEKFEAYLSGFELTEAYRVAEVESKNGADPVVSV